MLSFYHTEVEGIMAEIQGRAREGLESAARAPEALVKKNLEGLREFCREIGRFLKAPGSVAIRICECCINVD